jgi:putative membrane-bound dehydrogenase-like protein
MLRPRTSWRAGAATFFLALGLTAAEKADLKPAPDGPLSPRAELATFRLSNGFHAELVACEPGVVDPVAMCFDEDGRIVVCEMRGYPNAGVGTGVVTSGRIKILEDRDGDGLYETSTVYADTLRLPMGVMPWRGGYLVAQAPDLLYLEDTDGDGKADRKRILYTGFALSNIQQMINNPQWALDNWVHACAGLTGGAIRCPEKPDADAVELRGRGVRFHPDAPGSLEPTSGGGQYGLAADDYQRWFVNTNSQHLRHIVLPDHYLRRNPALPVSAVTLDIPEHGAACKVFRISPFEAWRVERTTRRKNSELARRLPSTELVPGGYVTSGCSPVVYCADAFPPSHRGSVFVCDPANNLVLRDTLTERGATFVAHRADAEQEFLASTDNWFRPVHLTVGPDGALYVLDFYREVIETPLSLPDDIKTKLNLESRGRGRIWRIVADGAPRHKKPALRKAPTVDLVRHLADPNQWWRLTAQRLLFQRQDKAAVPLLEALARTCPNGPGRAHALWTLRGLHALKDELIVAALKDPEAGVREQALRLADARMDQPAVRTAVLHLGRDPSARVRFQLAFTLGETSAPEAGVALAALLRSDGGDSWTQTAVLSSASRLAPVLLPELAHDAALTTNAGGSRLVLMTRLAALVGTRASDADLRAALGLLRVTEAEPAAWQLAVLEGLGQGLRNTGRPLAKMWDTPPPALKDGLEMARTFFAAARVRASNPRRTPAERVAALRILADGPFTKAEAAAAELLTPQTPPEVQLAAARMIALHENSGVAGLLLASWAGYSPAVRREVLEGLFARPDRLTTLLDAIAAKKVLGVQIEPQRLEQLRRHPNAAIRKRSETVLTGQAAPERRQVIEGYRAALDLKAEPSGGKAVFKRVCATCHRLENEGHEVGPDLLSALRNKSPEQLLIDILDPSREVDPRYLNYTVITKRGQLLSGLIAAETASSLTLRRGERAEDTILRSQIDEIQATAKSVMPDGLEQQLTKQDLADVIAYLRAAAAK